MEVGPAVRAPGRQLRHRHDRHAEEDDEAQVRDPLPGDVLEDRVEADPVLDHRPVRVPAQAVGPCQDVGDAELEVGDGGERAARGAEEPPGAPRHDQDPVAAAAARRFDDEVLPPVEEALELAQHQVVDDVAMVGKEPRVPS